MNTTYLERANEWLSPTFDAETQAQIQQMIAENPKEL